MHQRNKILITAVAATLLLAGCGGESKESGNGSNSEGAASNIPYLKQNHANYKQDGSNMTPAPTKDASKMSIDWTIEANSKEAATKLADHIRYMESKLLADQNPRAFDKLFLMEAYMKYNGYYTTSIEQSGTSVVVSKQAKNGCAYRVIATHSDAVSDDFFARGDITKDYSSIAEGILNSSDCSTLKSNIESYIAQRQKQRGRM